ncbi:MAG: hypothetical protein MZV70_41695 [Desulfobacterales bacterium]|nr:hypothetical protein [Desulfobacterales bacterium]
MCPGTGAGARARHGPPGEDRRRRGQAQGTPGQDPQRAAAHPPSGRRDRRAGGRGGGSPRTNSRSSANSGPSPTGRCACRGVTAAKTSSVSARRCCSRCC